MTMNQHRRIGATELEGIARTLLTTHGDRVQRWSLRQGTTTRILRLHSWHPDIPYVSVQTDDDISVLVWSEGDVDARSIELSDEAAIAEIERELSARVAGSFQWVYSWGGKFLEMRRADAPPRRFDRLFGRHLLDAFAWPRFDERPGEPSIRVVEPGTLEESAVEEVVEIVRSIDPLGLGFNDPVERDSWAFPLDEYDLVAQGIVSRAGIPPEELEEWIFVEFSEDWGLSFTRVDAAAMREALEPALERYRSTPDAGGTILRGSEDTTDDSREPT
jgi:hypothetical protein